MIDRTLFFPSIRAGCFGGVMKQPQVDGVNSILDEWEKRSPGGDLRHLAYMLATVIWETNHTMQPVREAYWLSEEWRRANLRYYPFYGRGFVQITWPENYDKFGKLLDKDLVNYPDQALEPSIAFDVMFEGMERGLFTGKSLTDFFLGSKENWSGARAIINGDADADHNGIPDSIDIGELAKKFFSALLLA